MNTHIESCALGDGFRELLGNKVWYFRDKIHRTLTHKKTPYILTGLVFVAVEAILIEEFPPLAGLLFVGVFASTTPILFTSLIE